MGTVNFRTVTVYEITSVWLKNLIVELKCIIDWTLVLSLWSLVRKIVSYFLKPS